jgi:hypothetical protein
VNGLLKFVEEVRTLAEFSRQRKLCATSRTDLPVVTSEGKCDGLAISASRIAGLVPAVGQFIADKPQFYPVWVRFGRILIGQA